MKDVESIKAGFFGQWNVGWGINPLSRHNPVSPDISTNLVTGAQEIMDNL